MKLYECPQCGQVLYFENVVCERCKAPLGYLSDQGILTALDWEGQSCAIHGGDGSRYRYCANYVHGVCNWLVPAEGENDLCEACRLNRTIPSLDDPAALNLWHGLEIAKHRLVYSLLRLGLPVQDKNADPQGGLAFEFLSDPPDNSNASSVLTGHADGLITINIAEADPVQREHLRTRMHEPYRTLLGHFRHEVGHYYWDRLVKPNAQVLQGFRDRFGDDTRDYGEALSQYYDQGPREDWRDAFVSAYATAHPWEDWAETWAHYLHMVDTLETTHAFGMRLRPKVEDKSGLSMSAPVDPYRNVTFGALLDDWIPVTIAVNSLNRSMGQPDLYPFVLSKGAMEKLEFVHQVVRGE